MPDARSHILASIERAVPQPANSEWANIPRHYRRSSNLSQAGLVNLLTNRLHDYDAQVIECSTGETREAIAAMLRARGHSRIVVPPGMPAQLLPEGFDFLLDEHLSHAELDTCDGVITQSTLAIAETGTIVLQNVPGQGRRAATLIPDYHLCLVEAARIVSTVPEAFTQLQAAAHLPTTFVSGPSATADIEMTRIKGVHGPRFLDVLIVGSQG